MHKRDIQKIKAIRSNDSSIKNPKITQITEIDLNGLLINDSNRIADALNGYFSNIGPKLADNIDPNEGNRSYLDYLSGQNTNATFQLKRNKFFSSFNTFVQTKYCRSRATGLNRISTRLLRECPDLIAEPFSLIFNRSIEIFSITPLHMQMIYYSGKCLICMNI